MKYKALYDHCLMPQGYNLKSVGAFVIMAQTSQDACRYNVIKDTGLTGRVLNEESYSSYIQDS